MYIASFPITAIASTSAVYVSRSRSSLTLHIHFLNYSPHATQMVLARTGFSVNTDACEKAAFYTRIEIYA